MFRKIFLIILLLLLSGCATSGGPRRIATVSIVAVHGTLALIQDTERAMVCGQMTAPPAGQCVPEDTHKQISLKLAEAFGYDQAVARVIRDLPRDAVVPTNVTELVEKITGIIRTVMELIPASNAKSQLLVKIGG